MSIFFVGYRVTSSSKHSIELIGLFTHFRRLEHSRNARKYQQIHKPKNQCITVIADAASKFSLNKAMLKSTVGQYSFYTAVIRISNYFTPRSDATIEQMDELDHGYTELVLYFFKEEHLEFDQKVCNYIRRIILNKFKFVKKVTFITDGCKNEFKSGYGLYLGTLEDSSFNMVYTVANHMSTLSGRADGAHWNLRLAIRKKLNLEADYQINSNKELYSFCEDKIAGIHGKSHYEFHLIKQNIINNLENVQKENVRYRLKEKESKLEINTGMQRTLHRLEAYNVVNFNNKDEGIKKLSCSPYYNLPTYDMWELFHT